MRLELDAMIEAFRDSRAYLEIGARYGDTFFEDMSALPKGSIGVAVDMPGDVWGRDDSLPHLEAVCDELRKMGHTIHLLLGDSTSPEIIAAVDALGPYDAALIDGDHRLAGVKADYENYGPLCAAVAFHDIVGQGQHHGANYVQVPEFWESIKRTRPSWEIVAAGSKMGIGIIRP